VCVCMYVRKEELKEKRKKKGHKKKERESLFFSLFFFRLSLFSLALLHTHIHSPTRLDVMVDTDRKRN